MSTTTTPVSLVRKPKATKDFKALVAFLGSEEQAIVAWNRKNPTNPIGEVAPATPALSPEAAALVAAGFLTEEEALNVTVVESTPDTVVTPLTSKDHSDLDVAERGFVHVRGRVYTNPALIEAQVRVLKTGRPEVIDLAGTHHIKAVAVFRTDDGASVALQNLGLPRES